MWKDSSSNLLGPLKQLFFVHMTNLTLNKQLHGYHLVDPSPWPLIAAFSALSTTFGGVLYMHGYQGGYSLMCLGFLMVLFMMGVWWRDVIREAMYEGQHTDIVQKGIRMGMLLFIVSEIMFFFAFFWGFFHVSFNPSIVLGGQWPPVFLTTLDPWKIPLLNTIILLTSGCTITICHNAIIAGWRNFSIFSLLLTIVLAIIFTKLQEVEYVTAPFGISDSVYGACFFLTTGFHGFHVFVGTCFLTVCLIRIFVSQFTKQHHFGFEAAAWYWHFVDVVWLFLFVTIYWWGS